MTCDLVIEFVIDSSIDNSPLAHCRNPLVEKHCKRKLQTLRISISWSAKSKPIRGPGLCRSMTITTTRQSYLISRITPYVLWKNAFWIYEILCCFEHVLVSNNLNVKSIFWLFVLGYAASNLNLLFTSLNSAQQLTNWKSSGGDPCGENWKGITCSGSKVTEMWISDNPLWFSGFHSLYSIVS